MSDIFQFRFFNSRFMGKYILEVTIFGCNLLFTSVFLLSLMFSVSHNFSSRYLIFNVAKSQFFRPGLLCAWNQEKSIGRKEAEAWCGGEGVFSRRRRLHGVPFRDFRLYDIYFGISDWCEGTPVDLFHDKHSA